MRVSISAKQIPGEREDGREILGMQKAGSGGSSWKVCMQVVISCKNTPHMASAPASVTRAGSRGSHFTTQKLIVEWKVFRAGDSREDMGRPDSKKEGPMYGAWWWC